MARRADDTLVSCSMDWNELAVLAEIRRAGGITSDANVIRTALWSLAEEMQIDMPNGVFDQRRPPGPTAEIRKARWPNGPAIKVKKESGRGKPKRSAANHPWRGPEGLMS